MKINSNKKSIEIVNNFLDKNTDMNEMIKLIKEDPNSSEDKKLQRKFKNFLEMISSYMMYMMYDALQSSKYITQTFQTAKRYR